MPGRGRPRIFEGERERFTVRVSAELAARVRTIVDASASKDLNDFLAEAVERHVEATEAKAKKGRRA